MAAPDPIRLCRRLLARDRFAAAIGVRLVEVRDGYARTRLRLGPGHLNGVGVVQGGAVFTLADTAFAAACNSHGTVAVGLDTSMTFVRGAQGGVLEAESREVSLSRRVSVCEVRVVDGEGALVAVFRGTAFRKEESIATLLRSRGARTRSLSAAGAAGGARTRSLSAAGAAGGARTRSPSPPLRGGEGRGEGAVRRRGARSVTAGRTASAGSAARTARR